MRPLPFSKALIKKYPFIYAEVQTKFIEKWVTYMINHKWKKIVNVKKWIKKQVDEPSPLVLDSIKNIPINNSHDFQAVNLLKLEERETRYEGDSRIWDMMEYWQTAHETTNLHTGDCEDGAIRQYVRLRLLGVPANRLTLFAGEVKIPGSSINGGHCWLGYKPDGYPFHYVFLDWCYYFDKRSVEQRPMYQIRGKEIEEYVLENGYYKLNPNGNYKSIWFGWNEEISYKEVERKMMDIEVINMTEETKKWYMSKTFWLNVLAILGIIFTGLSAMLTAGQAVTVLAILNLIVRALTQTKLDWKFF